jgi:hypothetical protein
MQEQDIYLESDPPPSEPAPRLRRHEAEGMWALAGRVTWVGGLVLALSSFMDWYEGSGVGVKLAVIGWHTGVLGKLVFVIGLAVVAIELLRQFGFSLPTSAPESLVVIALGVLAAVFVLVRVISIPAAMLPANSVGVGLWVSLIAALAVIVGGLMRAAEEL